MFLSSREKKKKLSFLIVCLLLISMLSAEDAVSSESYEIGIYFKDYVPLGRMADHASNFAGGGIFGEYHMPLLSLVPDMNRSSLAEKLNVGFSISADFEVAKAKPYVSSWYATNIFAGVFLEIPLTNWMSVQPTLEYGVQLDSVTSSRIANGLYPSQSLQISPTVKFRLGEFSGNLLNLIVSPFWSVGFEKTHNADYVGVKVGISWRFGEKTAEEIIKMEPVAALIPAPVSKPEPVMEPEPVPVVEPEPVPEPEPAVEVVVVEKVEVKQNKDGSVAINIPTLAFMSNSAELTDAASNQKTIQQVFDILSDELYAEYRVIITGYVNPDGIEWTESENELALNRAETVRQSLITRGIDENRLEARHGFGKTDNNEFNRRVEFTLTK